jgi:hypothetical protein
MFGLEGCPNPNGSYKKNTINGKNSKLLLNDLSD